MPRPASKKKPAKPVVKSTVASTGSAAEKILEKALKQLDVQSGKLRIARDKLRQKRVSVAKNASSAATTALEKAHAAVATHSLSHSQLTNSVRLAKAEVRIEAVLKKAHDAQETAQLKLEKAALKMAENSAEELKAAVERFEQRWLKQREQANAKKLKLVAARSRTKIKAAEKKAKSDASVIRKRASQLSAKPVATPGRPGRPAGSVAKTTKSGAAPKRRGRPAKIVAKSAASSEPKRRGRPPKATSVKTAAPSTTLKSTDAPKKRGRPAKAKPAVAAKATKKVSQAKVTAKASTSVSKASAPKRRGRPPKVAKS